MNGETIDQRVPVLLGDAAVLARAQRVVGANLRVVERDRAQDALSDSGCTKLGRKAPASAPYRRRTAFGSLGNRTQGYWLTRDTPSAFT